MPEGGRSVTNPWKSVRCLFESPILDERKWAKLPKIPADAFILDLEDAVPLDGKEQARRRVVDAIRNPSYFADRLTVPRPNPLSTPWGREDVLAVTEAGAQTLMIAKVDAARDIDDVRAVCLEAGRSPTFVVSIESALGVLNSREILGHPSVVAATFGPGDLHVDVGMSLYEPDGSQNPGMLYPKVTTILAGVAAGVPVLGIAFAPDLKNLADVGARIAAEKRLGFSGCCAFYPPHVGLINAVFTPSDADVARAHDVMQQYEAAVADGKPAVQLPTGEALLMHQYKEAQATLARTR
jgi:citrate lyase beta subunit